MNFSYATPAMPSDDISHYLPVLALGFLGYSVFVPTFLFLDPNLHPIISRNDSQPQPIF